jgi:heat shock protein HtpX
MERRIMFNEARNNKIKSFIMMVFFVIIIGFLGAVAGLIYNNLYFGIIMAVIISIIYSLIGFYSGDKMILSMSGAKPVTKKEYPYLYNTIEGLTIASGLKNIPKAYVIDDSAMNAFATGKDPEHASITVTTGLLKTMNRQELEGVIAHEMSHIKNYDIRFMMLTAILVGIITLISDFLLRSFLWGGKSKSDSKDAGNLTIIFIVVGLIFAILAPLIGEMIKLAIGRKREYLADADGATLTRYPQGLASALRKISKDPDPLVDKANKATAHLFISTPFRAKKSLTSRLFSTHPPIEERIKRLEEM